MPPVPALDTAEILSLTRDLLDRGNAPTEFELARLDHLIEKLANADIQASQSFRGVYYALQGDGPNAMKYHKLALSHSKYPDAYQHCAISLLCLEKPVEATRILLQGIKKTGEDPILIDALLRGAYLSDNHALIAQWLPKFEELTGEKHDVAFWLEEDDEDESMIPELLEESRNGPTISLEDLQKELGL
jgi:hypothetical protein